MLHDTYLCPLYCCECCEGWGQAHHALTSRAHPNVKQCVLLLDIRYRSRILLTWEGQKKILNRVHGTPLFKAYMRMKPVLEFPSEFPVLWKKETELKIPRVLDQNSVVSRNRSTEVFGAWVVDHHAYSLPLPPNIGGGSLQKANCDQSVLIHCAAHLLPDQKVLRKNVAPFLYGPCFLQHRSHKDSLLQL